MPPQNVSSSFSETPNPADKSVNITHEMAPTTEEHAVLPPNLLYDRTLCSQPSVNISLGNEAMSIQNLLTSNQDDPPICMSLENNSDTFVPSAYDLFLPFEFQEFPDFFPSQVFDLEQWFNGMSAGTSFAEESQQGMTNSGGKGCSPGMPETHEHNMDKDESINTVHA
jgi:hypothetical protein